MEHQFQTVDILDKTGKIIGQKQRRELNKQVDIYHAVYIFLITPEKRMALSIIPSREDLPNLYVHQYGATMATIRRSDETPNQAAVRGISRELFMEDVDLEFVAESMEKLEDDRYTYMSIFAMYSEIPSSYSLLDIEQLQSFNRDEFTALLVSEPKKIAPTLRRLWQKYGDKLPV